MTASGWASLDGLEVSTWATNVLRDCRHHYWPKADHVRVEVDGDGWRVCLAAGYGRDIRYGSAFLSAQARQTDEGSFVDALIEAGNRAYRMGWQPSQQPSLPPPLPPFRIGTRGPRRLKPADRHGA